MVQSYRQIRCGVFRPSRIYMNEWNYRSVRIRTSDSTAESPEPKRLALTARHEHVGRIGLQ
jgi:hypothetical protein